MSGSEDGDVYLIPVSTEDEVRNSTLPEIVPFIGKEDVVVLLLNIPGMKQHLHGGDMGKKG